MDKGIRDQGIYLGQRTRDHVKEYWERTQDEEIRRLFPFSGVDLTESLRLFEESQKPGASSYGRVIYVDGRYVGDVWCYCIDEKEERSAMLSILIFDKTAWGRGIGQTAMRLFLQEVFQRYSILTVGAFTFADNERSIRALKQVGFEVKEEFEEGGRKSVYLECLSELYQGEDRVGQA